MGGARAVAACHGPALFAGVDWQTVQCGHKSLDLPDIRIRDEGRTRYRFTLSGRKWTSKRVS